MEIGEIRYYRGKVKCELWGLPFLDFKVKKGEKKPARKVLIKYLEEGVVGNKKEGYKEVSINDGDIVFVRFLEKKRRFE